MAYTADQINTIYQNVLFRPAEPAAIAFYANSNLTDAQVRQQIELSSEATQFTAPVVRLFQAALGRLPTANDLKFYVTEYKYQGISLDAIASQFANSTEYANRAGGTTVTSTFIQTLYQDVLGRSASASEVSFYTGKTASAVLTAVSFSPEATQFNAAATVTFLDSAALGNPNTGTLQSQNGINVGTAFTLTTGTDSFTGTGGNDTFNAPSNTLTALDKIDGGTGNDALNLSSTTAFTQPSGITVSNIETVNLQAVGGATISTASGSGFTGVTQLTVISTGGTVSATADSTTNETVSNLTAGASTTSVLGGKNVAVNVTGATTGANITVGSSAAAPTGTVTVNNAATLAGAVTGNTIAVVGGTVVNVASTATNSTVNTTATTGAISVLGTTATTSVTVSQSAAVTASATVAGIANGAVTIADANAGSATVANTISAVALANYGNSTISSTALNTVNLSGTGGTLGITTGGSAAQIAANTTLNLGLGGGTLGVITDSSNQFATVNATLTANTTVGGITDTALRTLNLSGTGVLGLTAVNTALTSITQTGAAGLNANLSAVTGLTAIDASGTTGSQTLTLNATTQTFKGGTGRDVITIGQDATKSIAAGSGTTDQLVLTAAGTTYTAANTGANVTGFEQLGVNNAGGGTYDLSAFAGINKIEVIAAASTNSFINVNPGTSLQIDAAGDTVSYATTGSSGATGNVAVNLQGVSSSAGTTGFTTTALTLTDGNGTGIGNVTINSDSSVAATGHVITTLTDNALTNLAITGTGGLSITNAATAATSLTISDNATGTSATPDGIGTLTASGNALGNISYSGSHAFTIGTLTDNVANLTISNANTGTTGVLTIGGHSDANLAFLTLNGAVAYTGSSSNTGAITVSGGSDNANVSLTLNGGTGIKTVTLGNGNNTVVTAGGNDAITLGTGANTVTAGAGADTITFGTHTGVDRIIQAATADSGTFTNPGASNSVSTTAFDVASGLKAGDQISLSSYVTALSGTTATGSTVANFTGAADNSDALIRGTYNATTKVFVGSSTGTDSLYVYDGNGTAGAVAQEAIVLVGYTGTTTTHGATGLVTLG